MVVLVSFNVAGWQTTLQQILEHCGSLEAWLAKHSVDILALQEAKVPAARLKDEPRRVAAQIAGYESFWSCCAANAGPKGAAGGGYSGVCTYARSGMVTSADSAPLRCEEFDREGRCLLTDHGDFVLLNVYVPAAGEAYRRLPYKIRFLELLKGKVMELKASGRCVVIAGDLNIGRRPEDVYFLDRVVDLSALWKSVSAHEAPCAAQPSPPTPLSESLRSKLRAAKEDVEAALEGLQVVKVAGKGRGGGASGGRGSGGARAEDSWKAMVPSKRGGPANRTIGKKFPSESEALTRLGRHSVTVRVPDDDQAGARHGHVLVEAWRDNWLSVEHLQDVLGAVGAALSKEEVLELGEAMGGSYYAPCLVAWLDRLLADAGMVDTFTVFHGAAKARFTAWSQYTNARYTNRGVRIDYILVDERLSGALRRGGELAGGGYRPRAALEAATASGRWRQAPFDGSGLEEASPEAHDTQFRAPHTGIIYTPPKYSDHAAVCALLELDIWGQQLRKTPQTVAAQPFRAWRGIKAFLRPAGSASPIATPDQSVRPVEAAAARAAMAFPERSPPGLIGSSRSKEIRDPLCSTITSGSSPVRMFSSLGSSYRDAAAASGRNYRDFAAASSPGHSLGDYWRQRKWKPGQLKLERTELPTVDDAGQLQKRRRTTPGVSDAANEPPRTGQAAPAQQPGGVREPGAAPGEGIPKHEAASSGGAACSDDMFMIDTVEDGGRFFLHCVSASGARVILHCLDYTYALHISAPRLIRRGLALQQQGDGAPGDGNGHFWQEDEAQEVREMTQEETNGLISAVSAALLQLVTIPPVAGAAELRPGLTVEVVHRTPLMFYREGHLAEPQPFLCVRFPATVPVKKASEALRRVASQGCLCGHQALRWDDATVYEDDVKLRAHFLHDCRLSAGSWIRIDPAGTSQVPSRHLRGHGWAAAEICCPWRSIHSLTADAATQAISPTSAAAAATHAPSSGAGSAADCSDGIASRQGHLEHGLAPLRVVTMECLQVSGREGQSPAPEDPVIVIACRVCHDWDSQRQMSKPAPPDDCQQHHHQQQQQQTRASRAAPQTHVFTWSKACTRPSVSSCVHLCKTEADMLRQWRSWFAEEADPHVLVVYGMQRSLAVLVERFKILGMGPLSLSCTTAPHPLKVESVVMYSAEWVRSKTTMGGRMASTSNQETFKAEVEGRLVLDLERVILTSHLLPTYSMPAAVQAVLGRPLEDLRPADIQGLWTPQAGGSGPTRLASYATSRAETLRDLLRQLNAIEETVEMARAAGLTFLQVLYNAQIVRVFSLIVRASRLLGYLVANHKDPSSLSESPYLIHPVDTSHAGLYEAPVAVLDFASLYPSLFSTYNLCYSTLVHQDDVKRFKQDDLFQAPNGAVFVREHIRRGVLPQLLAGLVAARTQVRASLKSVGSMSILGRVLDGRQKALKLMANAMYGFTGAQPSPVRLVALADTCLSLGAAVCHRARETLEDEASALFADKGRHGISVRVIYAQTDSLFVELRGATLEEVGAMGADLSKLAVKRLAQGLRMNFERVLCPFLLLHVNRYAGRGFDPDCFQKTSLLAVPGPGGTGTAMDIASGSAGPGKLLVKGVKSEWRLSPPVVREALSSLLHTLLMREPGPSAAEAAAQRALEEASGCVRRLLAGQVSVHHLVMTGGLWRVTGTEIDGAAQEGASAADIHGPHANLAVRLRRRDGGRRFVLGERIPYVLLAGHRNQEEAAEDPVEALRNGSLIDYALYSNNKLLPSLREILQLCLPPAQLQRFETGDHHRVRSSVSSTAARGPAAGVPEAAASPVSQPASVETSTTWQCPRCTLLNPRRRKLCEACGGGPPPGVSPASPGGATAAAGPRRGSTRGRSSSSSSSRSSADRAKPGTAARATPPSGGGAVQMGLRRFVVPAAQCQGCRCLLPSSSGGTSGADDEQQTSGQRALCDCCSPRAPDMYLERLRELRESEGALAEAVSSCLRCHSGGVSQEIMCSNHSCPRLYRRVELARKVETTLKILQLEW